MSKIYYDIRKKPFAIYGLDESTTDEFRRIPTSVAENTSKDVLELHKNTSGGRVRFKTNSNSVSIRAKIEETDQIPFGTPALICGFDLYLDRDGNKHDFLGTFKFDFDKRFDYEATLSLPSGEKELTLNMPLYGSVLSLEIGLEEGASLSPHSPYKYEKPIVFYGSSITQGSVTRAGKLYSAIISRKLDTNFKCLGFSGACKAEDEMVEYIASLEMSAFVSDYDHNTPSYEHLKNTHFKMYQTIREKHPDIPYFMITKPDFHYDDVDTARRCIIMESYLKAYNSGDKNVYFIDGSAFFNGVELLDCTVDGIHPGDDGQRKMADYIGDVISKAMKI